MELLKTSKGYAHQLIVALLVVASIAGIGTYYLVGTHAQTAKLEVNGKGATISKPTKRKCAQLNRKWSNSSCAWSSKNVRYPNAGKVCATQFFSYVKGWPYDHCVAEPIPHG